MYDFILKHFDMPRKTRRAVKLIKKRREKNEKKTDNAKAHEASQNAKD